MSPCIMSLCDYAVFSCYKALSLCITTSLLHFCGTSYYASMHFCLIIQHLIFMQYCLIMHHYIINCLKMSCIAVSFYSTALYMHHCLIQFQCIQCYDTMYYCHISWLIYISASLCFTFFIWNHNFIMPPNLVIHCFVFICSCFMLYICACICEFLRTSFGPKKLNSFKKNRVIYERSEKWRLNSGGREMTSTMRLSIEFRDCMAKVLQSCFYQD